MAVIVITFGSVTGVSSAISILNDSFETATHPGGFRTVFSAGGSAYYTKTGSLSLGNDSSFGSTRALTMTSTETGYSIISPLGGTISLAAVGDTLTFGFKVRFTRTGAAADAAAFRFGIYSSNGTPVTGDSYFFSTVDNDRGYGAVIGNTTAPGAGGTIFNETASPTQTGLLGGDDRRFLTASGAGPAISDQVPHTVSLTLTRTSATVMTISYTFGGTTITTTDTTGIHDTFDQITFGTGFLSPVSSFNIDDVKLDASNFSPIPEPSAAVLSAVAAAGLVIRRRRK